MADRDMVFGRALLKNLKNIEKVKTLPLQNVNRTAWEAIMRENGMPDNRIRRLTRSSSRGPFVLNYGKRIHSVCK